MKADRNRVDGQMDLFEAMNRAAAAVDRMVEEEKSGNRKKKQGKKAAASASGEKEKAAPQKKSEEIIRGCDMRASMQKTFLNPEDGDFATVAYIDYHMVYAKEWNSPVSLRRFDNSKEAVDYYMAQIEKIQRIPGIECTKEHEPFVDVKYVMENIYAECE